MVHKRCTEWSKLVPRPKGKKPTIRLSITVDRADHAELARLAAEHDLSLAWVVRRAITDFVERNRDGLQRELPLPRGPSATEGRAT